MSKAVVISFNEIIHCRSYAILICQQPIQRLHGERYSLSTVNRNLLNRLHRRQ